jgi:hypothetical protein
MTWWDVLSTQEIKQDSAKTVNNSLWTNSAAEQIVQKQIKSHIPTKLIWIFALELICKFLIVSPAFLISKPTCIDSHNQDCMGNKCAN